jgi:hypothetical protein
LCWLTRAQDTGYLYLQNEQDPNNQHSHTHHHHQGDMLLLTAYHPINALIIGIECLILLLFLSIFYFIYYRRRCQPIGTHTFKLQSCPHSATDILVPGDSASPDSNPTQPPPAFLIGSWHNLQLDRSVRTTMNPWIGRQLNR